MKELLLESDYQFLFRNYKYEDDGDTENAFSDCNSENIPEKPATPPGGKIILSPAQRSQKWDFGFDLQNTKSSDSECLIV